MQKVIRQSVIKRNRAAKDAKEHALKIYQTERAQFKAQTVVRDRAEHSRIKAERLHRREDWVLGPLAPNRDAGAHAGRFGTVKTQEHELPPLPQRLRTAPESDGWEIPGTAEGWKGEGNIGNLTEGDRVCVVRGPAGIRGKIGRVRNVNWEANSIKVEGVNTADIEIARTAARPEGHTALFMSGELSIPVADVLLVHRLDDRDVLVRHLRGGGPWLQRAYGTTTPAHTRYISGLDIEVPWPEPEANEFEAYGCDTHREEMETLTFMPSVFDPMLGSARDKSIMDELRSKYGKRRDDHEREFLTNKLLADARSTWYEKRMLLTPLQEAVAKRRAEGEKRAEELRERGPTEETLRLVRERQAQAQAQAAEKAKTI